MGESFDIHGKRTNVFNILSNLIRIRHIRKILHRNNYGYKNLLGKVFQLFFEVHFSFLKSRLSVKLISNENYACGCARTHCICYVIE